MLGRHSRLGNCFKENITRSYINIRLEPKDLMESFEYTFSTHSKGLLSQMLPLQTVSDQLMEADACKINPCVLALSQAELMVSCYHFCIL